MDEAVPFGGRAYWSYLVVLLVARGADLFSTWMATPNLVLEANPIAKALRWKWGVTVNLVACVLFAFWPLPAIMIGTTSALVAAHNFQSAWLMRASGEESYGRWRTARFEETPITVFLLCLFLQSGLVGLVGVVLVLSTGGRELIPTGIGLGIVGYALSVLVFTLVSVWRNRRRRF